MSFFSKRFSRLWIRSITQVESVFWISAHGSEISQLSPEIFVNAVQIHALTR